MEHTCKEKKIRLLLISCFGRPKLLAPGHTVHLQPPTILNSISYRSLQHYLCDLLSEEAIKRNKVNQCYKKQQNHTFIPVKEFSPSYLPLKIRHTNVYVWLQRASHLVVKLNKDYRSNATGRLCSLVQYKNKTTICKDKNCPHVGVLGTDHEVYGGLGVIANIHFVKSEIDAENTRVHFLYNGATPEPVLIEKCYYLHSANSQFDYCVMSCYVHDKRFIEFINVLDGMVNHAWSQIPEPLRLRARDYAIIISHPHGHAKQISIGRVVNSEVRGKGELQNFNVKLLSGIYNACEKNGGMGKIRFDFYNNWFHDKGLEVPVRITWYTTSTCVGSSGAPVFMGDTVMEEGKEINQAHTHRSVDYENNLNNCFT